MPEQGRGVGKSLRSGHTPPIYRCRCWQCGWRGYRRGYFLHADGPSNVENRIHVDPCPHCDAEDVHGLCPRLEQRWRDA
jgi:hypothetical protein